MKRYIKSSRTPKQFMEYVGSLADSGNLEPALDTLDLKRLCDRISDKYQWLYDNEGEKMDGYYEMTAIGDFVLAGFKDFARELINERGDVLSSDREVAALAYALEELI